MSAFNKKEGAPAARAVDFQHVSESSFVAFTRHRDPAYFDQSIHLCSQAGFSPRIRYEASIVHGVLELVGAGAGRGARVATAQGGCNPMLPVLDVAVASIFKGLTRRLQPCACK